MQESSQICIEGAFIDFKRLSCLYSLKHVMCLQAYKVHIEKNSCQFLLCFMLGGIWAAPPILTGIKLW